MEKFCSKMMMVQAPNLKCFINKVFDYYEPFAVFWVLCLHDMHYFCWQFESTYRSILFLKKLFSLTFGVCSLKTVYYKLFEFLFDISIYKFLERYYKRFSFMKILTKFSYKKKQPMSVFLVLNFFLILRHFIISE